MFSRLASIFTKNLEMLMTAGVIPFVVFDGLRKNRFTITLPATKLVANLVN